MQAYRQNNNIAPYIILVHPVVQADQVAGKWLYDNNE